MKRKGRSTTDEAAAIALSGLGYLAANELLLLRFLALTGTTPDHLEAEAESEPLQLAVLEHILADESLLLAFAASAGVPPAEVAEAHALLTRGKAEASEPQNMRRSSSSSLRLRRGRGPS